MSDHIDQELIQIDTLKERDERLRKLAEIKAMGIEAYPERFEKTHTIAQILKCAEDEKNIKTVEEITDKTPTTYRTAGRIVMSRTHGKLSFLHLLDDSGKMQCALMQDILGKDTYKFFEKKVDLGDFIGVAGELFRTKHGEVTLLVTEFTFLGKALRPLPDKFHGLKDKETLYRQRYLDLISNQETKKRFEFRSNFIRALREFYWKENFYEVETSVFMETATGAAANPYKTHHDAMDLDMVLRISHELPLKKLIVGGFERVFEIGKAFRNEGIDPTHLPEHTHLEHYVAYWNFEDNIKFTEKMFDYIFETLDLNRTVLIKDKEGTAREVNFATPWQRIDYIQAFKDTCGIAIDELTDADELREIIAQKGISIEGSQIMGLTTLVDHIYKKLIRPSIVQPTVLYNFPLYMQPLARKNSEFPQRVDQFQLVVNGWEILKAYSELVDPVDQEERFVDQAKAKAGGDEEDCQCFEIP